MKTVFDMTIDFDQSHGSYLVDKNTGHEYLDMFSMYSSLPIGYNHPVFDDAFREELAGISYIRMANNVMKSDELKSFVDVFRPHVFSDYMHFCCTGALAVESGLKCAMEYKKQEAPKVLALKNSFHGVNSWGFATDRFFPNNERMRYFPKGDWLNLPATDLIDYLKHKDTSSIAAVLLEPIQCTAGDLYVPPEHLLEIRELCTKHDICCVVDEIQTGFGTTGSMWYSNKIGLEPDVLVFGKKSQVCGIVAVEKYHECFTSPYQKLDVTFDGDLSDMIRAKYVLKAYEEGSLVKRANSNSEKFRDILSECVDGYRSEGHLIAFDLENRENRDQFIQTCKSNYFLCSAAGERSIRMRPNLAITDDEIAHFGKIIRQVFPN